MSGDLIRELCVVTWLPLFIVLWVVIAFRPGRIYKRKK